MTVTYQTLGDGKSLEIRSLMHRYEPTGTTTTDELGFLRVKFKAQRQTLQHKAT